MKLDTKIKSYGVNDLMTIGIQPESQIIILQFAVTSATKNDSTDRVQLFIKPEDIDDILKFINKSVKDFKKEHPKCNVYA
jgi:hypothetical protein